MNQEELIAKIDAFLWELLPEDERAMVEKEIDNNPDFRATVAERHFQHAVVKRMKKEALTAKLKSLREKTATENAKEDPSVKTIKLPQIAPSLPKTTPEKRGIMTPLRRVLAMAASVALLVTVGSYYWAKGNYDEVQLAHNAKAKADTMFFPKITNDKFASGLDPKDSADIYFKTGKFDKTIAVYEDYFAQLDKMRLNTEGSSLGDSTQQKAEWQLVLTYRAARKPIDEKFTKRLNQMAQNPQHRFYEDARALQQKINSFWWKYLN